MAVGSVKGKRPARFDADQLFVFARAFEEPVWRFLLPPSTWRTKPVRVRLSKNAAGESLDSDTIFDLAVGPLKPPEPRNKKERVERQLETERLFQLVMQFMVEHHLFPKFPPPIVPSDLPPEVRAEIEQEIGRVLKKHGIGSQLPEVPLLTPGQLQMAAEMLEFKSTPQRRLSDGK
jgi:hypothetical protein